MTFSIIIPLYNKASYVENALQSVFAQTFKDWELIVVDDGSTDDSLEVVKRFADSQVRQFSILSQKNAGVSTARNNGVEVSHGDYLCFLDADDWWSPDFLTQMDLLVRQYPNAGIYGADYYYVKNGKKRILPKECETGYMDYFRTYANCGVMPLWTGAVCVPTMVFREMNGFKKHLKLGEDFDLWVRIALKYRVVFLKKQLAYYNQDVDLGNRAIGNLYSPQFHILWHLDYLAVEESKNADLKQLVDNLRTYGLFPYYLSSLYGEDARKELKKVDWSKQPSSVVCRYKRPICWLRIYARFMDFASKMKQLLINCLQ